MTNTAKFAQLICFTYQGYCVAYKMLNVLFFLTRVIGFICFFFFIKFYKKKKVTPCKRTGNKFNGVDFSVNFQYVFEIVK